MSHLSIILSRNQQNTTYELMWKKLHFNFNCSSFFLSVIFSESCVIRIRCTDTITVRFDLTSHWMPVLGLSRGQTDPSHQQLHDNGIHTFWWSVLTESVGTILQDLLLVRSFDAGFLVVCRYTPSGGHLTGKDVWYFYS